MRFTLFRRDRLKVRLLFILFPLLAGLLPAQEDSTSLVGGLRVDAFIYPQIDTKIAFQPGRMLVDSTVFNVPPPIYTHKVNYDTATGLVIITNSREGIGLAAPPLAFTLEEYKQWRLRKLTRKKFVDINKTFLTKGQVSGGGALVLKVPWEIKSKVFQNIFGNGTVKLKVTGNISFTLSGQLESREGSAVSSIQQNNQFRPKFDQQQQFTIEGQIGDKVKIEVQQNSQATFDLENNLRVIYTGYDDEIIQKLEAGNVSLSLPKTNYVTYSGKNKGLFGVKAIAKLGNLDVTTIASVEKGEKQKLDIKGGKGGEKEYVIKDYNYLSNSFFFVSPVFRDNWTVYDDKFQARGSIPVQDIEVYVSIPDHNQGGNNAWAFYSMNDPEYNNAEFLSISDEIPGTREKGNFKKLEKDVDYRIYEQWGVIQILQPVAKNNILAVAFALNNGHKEGDFTADVKPGKIQRLMLIKARNMSATEKYLGKTWDLMMRNVYYLGASDIKADALKLSIRLYNENNKLTDNSGRRFINLMGLDRLNSSQQLVDKGDNIPDADNGIVFDLEKGYLFFPALHPFDPLPQDSDFVFESKYYIRKDNGDGTYQSMYETTPSNKTLLLDISKFEIAVQTGQSILQTDFDLGFNVLPGSETVKLDGVVLQRDKDYLIDYFSGQLHITNQNAQRENADIEIEYERGAIFQLDKKTLFGMNAIYHFNDYSFIGFTGMFLNKSTIEQRVRVGQEPYMNFVWDLNTAFRFSPRFFTKMLNILPLIETKTASEISFETEYAQVLPNPNTQNSEKTGDNDGVAYIDDFEGSRRSTTLGIQYKGWVTASQPHIIDGVIIDNEETALRYADYQPKFAWYNPYDRVPIKDIWPERGKKLNANTDQRTDVLNLAWKQRPGNRDDWDKAWLGLYRSTQSIPDQQETKYIEMWIYLGDSSLIENETTLHIDLGNITEDYYVKYGGYNVLNTEDRVPRNNLLDDGEDIGLDGIPSENGGDPEDNWNITPLQNREVFPFGVNGTEGNGQAQGSRYPDTEDLDADGFLNLSNDYFTYEIKLNPQSLDAEDYFSADNNNGWYQLRIPLKDYKEKIGSPDESFQQILYFRFWLNNLPRDTSIHYISVASLDYVANEWKELGIAQNDSSAASPDPDLFSILVYNTDENANNLYPGAADYIPPPGVEGVVDPVTGVESKEQSLVFRFNNLPSGYSVVGKKNIYEVMNLANYQRIKMFIHGDHNLLLLPEEERGRQLEFILKIGKDLNNYYEYHMPIYPNWDEASRRNNLDIEIAELSKASFEPDKVFADPNKEGAWFKAIGNPSLRNVRYVTFSVKNVNPDPLNTYSGEVWFDEFRVTDVDKRPGSALRFKTRIKGADIFDIVANFESKDANFHTINEQNAAGFKAGTQEYLESQNITVNFQLGKLFPENSGINIPITAKYSASAKIPVFFPQTDRQTGYAINGIDERIQSLFGLRKLSPELDAISKISHTKSIGFRFSRKSKNSGWLADLTIDQLTFDLDLAEFDKHDDRTEINQRQAFSNKISYRIPWGKNNYILPFGWAKKIPLVRSLSGIKLYYTPSVTSFRFSANHDVQLNKLRTQTEDQDPVQKTTTTRSLGFEYKLLDNLGIKMNRNWNSKADHLGWTLPELYQNIVSKLYFGETTNIKQTTQLSFAPDISRYFKISYSASSSFDYKVTLTSPRQKDAGNALGQQISLSFRPNQLLHLIYDPNKGTRKKSSSVKSTGRRGRRGRGRGTAEEAKEEEKKSPEKSEEKDDSGFSFPNPLMWVYYVFDTWNSMKVDYKRTNNSTYGYVTDLPAWKYQLGLTMETTQLDSFPGRTILDPIFKQSDNLTASFGIKIARNVSTSVDYKWAKTKSWGVSSPKEDLSQSYFTLMFDPEKGDQSGIPLPNWSFSLSGIEKLPLLNTIFKTITLNHSRSGDQKTASTILITGEKNVDRVTTNALSPLLGIKMSFTNSLNMDARYNITQTYSSKSNGSNETWNQSKDLSVSITYATKGGFKIPIPLFGWDKKTFKNQLDFSLTFTKSERIAKSKDKISNVVAIWAERDKTSTWSLKPAVNFALSKRVRGSLFYEQSVDENSIRGKTTIKKFGVNVNLEIRE